MISEFKKRDRIVFLGMHDALTGLYNRNYYNEYIKKLFSKI